MSSSFLATAAHGTEFIVIDLETTGLDPDLDRIVECALIGLDARGRVVEEWSSRVGLPGVDHVGASELHHLDVASLAGAPSFAELLPAICDRLRGRVVVGHVLDFDVAFLTAECARAGYALPDLTCAGICTRELARVHLLGLSYGLAACCERARVPLVDAHTALGDARATAGLFRLLTPINDRFGELAHHARRLAWAEAPTPPEAIAPLPRAVASISVRADPPR